jgi:hypothetical protein
MSSNTVAVVINSCYDGFSLSTEGWEAYVRLGGSGGDPRQSDGRDVPRTDPRTALGTPNGQVDDEVAQGKLYWTLALL